MAKQIANSPDPQSVAVVLLADLAQIRADSRTHQDINARERIAKAADRITSIVEGKMTDELKAKLEQAAEILAGASASK